VDVPVRVESRIFSDLVVNSYRSGRLVVKGTTSCQQGASSLHGCCRKDVSTQHWLF
jgi:hypothetical protein